MRDEVAPPLTAISFALDVLLETGGGASVEELACVLDLGLLERALDDDLREMKNWRNKDRWEVKSPPRRFLHRASQDDVAWGALRINFSDVMRPYEKWHAHALARTSAARLEQISHIFALWSDGGSDAPSSSTHAPRRASGTRASVGEYLRSMKDVFYPSAHAGSDTQRSYRPDLSPAAIQSVIDVISRLPKEEIRSQLATVLTYVGRGADAELLAPAIQLVLHIDPPRLLDHVRSPAASQILP